MTEPRLIDGVTLRHFGATEYLSILRQLLEPCREPYWTEAVRSEILAGSGQMGCDNVLSSGFLGVPYQVATSGLAEVMRIRIALSDGTGPSTKNLGEAESIYVADRLNGIFVTDDNAAYEFAWRRLGLCRVLDTVDLLRESVKTGIANASEAQQIADAIRNTGRKLRRVHPPTFTIEYFEL